MWPMRMVESFSGPYPVPMLKPRRATACTTSALLRPSGSVMAVTVGERAPSGASTARSRSRRRMTRVPHRLVALPSSVDTLAQHVIELRLERIEQRERRRARRLILRGELLELHD